jgi:MFS family permease
MLGQVRRSRARPSLSWMRRRRAALPANVRALGWVSFANDLASELAYPVVPLFLTITLGAPVAVVGLIEGLAEGVAVGLRGISGWLSDRARGRVPWIFGGYLASAAARPIVAAAPAWGWVLGGRLTDRLGKAARTAPRDALIKDSTPSAVMGAAFGYHRALDTAGAVVGPLGAVVVLTLGASLRSVLWLAVVPGFVALLLLRRVREAPSVEASRVGLAGSAPIRVRMPVAFWFVLGVWVVFSLGNSSDVFLVLRSKELGLSPTLAILAYALYNIVYSGLAWPFGGLSDRVSRPLVLAGGLAVFALVYLGFAAASSSWMVWPLFIVYGVYIAATEGVARAWVADHAPAGASGTAYGIFAATTGAALLLASATAGLLWSRVSPSAPFVLGAVSASLALALLALRRLMPGSV